MALNPQIADRVYPPTAPYGVSREKIREFAEAIGEAAPVHDDVAPPTFAVTLTMRAEGQLIFDPEAGLDLTRLLHREQRFDHARPLRAGDEVTVTVAVTGVEQLGDTDVVSLRSDVRTVGGERVCTGHSTLVCRSDG